MCTFLHSNISRWSQWVALNAVSCLTSLGLCFGLIVSWQERRILGSIYSMTQQLRCQRGRQQQWDLEQPVESMELLISHSCSLDYLVRRDLYRATVIHFFELYSNRSLGWLRGPSM